MTDRHVRILRFVALKRQWELEDHDEADHPEGAVSADRRQHLKGLATRAKTRLTDAQQRRFRRE